MVQLDPRWLDEMSTSIFCGALLSLSGEPICGFMAYFVDHAFPVLDCSAVPGTNSIF